MLGLGIVQSPFRIRMQLEIGRQLETVRVVQDSDALTAARFSHYGTKVPLCRLADQEGGLTGLQPSSRFNV